MAKWEEDTKRMRENKEVGLYIGLAHHWFGFYYSTYPGYFSFILIAFEYKLLGVAEVMLFFPVVLIPVAIGYIPAYKAVMYKDRYLKYFKQFEKEDEAWHGKWKRRTWAFCLGGIFVMALGIFTFWGILDFGIIRQMFF